MLLRHLQQTSATKPQQAAELRVVLQTADDSSVSVMGLPVGAEGGFAMTLWFQQASNQGDTFQYLLSARDASLPPISQTTVFYPDQVPPFCCRCVRPCMQ